MVSIILCDGNGDGDAVMVTTYFIDGHTLMFVVCVCVFVLNSRCPWCISATGDDWRRSSFAKTKGVECQYWTILHSNQQSEY